MAFTLLDWVTDADRYIAQFGGCVNLTTTEKKRLAGELFDQFCCDCKPYWSDAIVFTTPNPATTSYALDGAFWAISATATRVVEIARVRSALYTLRAIDQGYLTSEYMQTITATTPTATPGLWGMVNENTVIFDSLLIPATTLTAAGWYYPLDIVFDTSDGTVMPFKKKWVRTLSKGLAAYFCDAEKRGDLLEAYATLQAEYELGKDIIRQGYGNLAGGAQVTPFRPLVNF